MSDAPAAEVHPEAVGLPDAVRVCLFDLDGVLTKTAAVHDRAWTEMFDAYLRERADREHEPFVPFDPDSDYGDYVDGKPRPDGVRDFLASRGISLPDGSPDDPPDAETVNGLGNRKNEILVRRIHDDGVETFPDSVAYVRSARDAGLRTAVVSSSANTRDILRVTGIADLFEHVVDGNDVARHGLKGKPAPDTFLAGATALGAQPQAAVVYEDALAGVEAGRAGGFGYVVGVNRLDPRHGEELHEHGADVVVTDLSELA